jgi:type 1 fimbriae regulatory protein FimB
VHADAATVLDDSRGDLQQSQSERVELGLCSSKKFSVGRAADRRRRAARADKLPWLFISERGQPMTRSAVNYLLRVAGESTGLKNVHPHMLRHSCGYYLANTGVDLRTMQDYLGHRDPKHTVHYTRVAGRRFEGLWK